MPCHHMQHVQNVGPNLFACNEKIAHVMPRDTAHAVMSCAHHTACVHRQAGHPNYMCRASNYNDKTPNWVSRVWAVATSTQ